MTWTPSLTILRTGLAAFGTGTRNVPQNVGITGRNVPQNVSITRRNVPQNVGMTGRNTNHGVQTTLIGPASNGTLPPQLSVTLTTGAQKTDALPLPPSKQKLSVSRNLRRRKRSVMQRIS
jgi:hypothetical protein